MTDIRGDCIATLHTNNMSLTSCMAIMIIVFRLNLRLHSTKRSSRLGPRSSMTMALYRPPHVPTWYTRGIPSRINTHTHTRLTCTVYRMTTHLVSHSFLLHFLTGGCYHSICGFRFNIRHKINSISYRSNAISKLHTGSTNFFNILRIVKYSLPDAEVP
jgi:hypothetical protein